ncbi:NSP1 protein [Mole Culex virus]|nr:NSP1 protein [Mole Culex virus]
MQLAFLIPILLSPFLYYFPPVKLGRNSRKVIRLGSDSVEQLATSLGRLSQFFLTADLGLAHAKYKAFLNGLNYAQFHTMKMFGVTATKQKNNKASRGYDKLFDLLLTSRLKLHGKVLSLCCGRGGWEQVIAPNPSITSIHSITFGAGHGSVGHENFTSKPFAGMHKVKVTYGDVRSMAAQQPDFLLFDGGESHPDPSKEATRAHDLLVSATQKHLHSGLKGFILKVLVPTHPPTIRYLTDIQVKYGTGALYRSAHSRTSNLEMYFISTPALDIPRSIRILASHVFAKASTKTTDPAKEYTDVTSFVRPKIVSRMKLLKPLSMVKAIKELGTKVSESGRTFAQWQSHGVYPIGNRGSSVTNIPALAATLTKGLVGNLPGLTGWLATDTTPRGFTKTFLTKIDVAPGESNPYEEELRLIYQAKAQYYKSIGFVHREYTWEEVEQLANKQGAAHYIDIHHANIGDFFKNPNWKDICDEVLKDLVSGTPTKAIFSSIGKREKKQSPFGPKGSRMVAYLPIAMRLVELKIFGNLGEITHPEMNHFAVGGLGLHDLGMRINERWVEVAESTDIAAFDTRIGLLWQTLECSFLMDLGLPKAVQYMYRLYSHPYVLIPMPGQYVRSELVEGRGQRMSGSKITYDMNTETRNNITLLRWVKALNIPLGEINAFVQEVMKPDNKWKIHGVTSGDDETSLFPAALAAPFTATYGIFHDIGFPRKDIPAAMATPLIQSINDVEFCSHSYEMVTYYQESTGRVAHRYMPTRNVHEIIGKARIWLGGAHTGLDSEAWISAQGNNLLVNYHHLRTCRALGMAYKAISNPKLILTATGSSFLKREWMREGAILDVINAILFGESTRYPVADFSVEKIRHLGYLPVNREIGYDPDSMGRKRSNWRDFLKPLCQQIITQHDTGGSLEIFSDWRENTLVRM